MNARNVAQQEAEKRVGRQHWRHDRTELTKLNSARIDPNMPKASASVASWRRCGCFWSRVSDHGSLEHGNLDEILPTRDNKARIIKM